MASGSPRFHVVDALRGFAIVSIMLLHNLEHFDFWYQAEAIPEWMKPIDQGIWTSMFFLFSGKSYGIFALLFGLTFFIQSNNQAKKGHDFRARFAWRLVLLFAFGMINSAFYQGDILTLYAVVGFGIIPFAKLGNRWVLLASILLLVQPLHLSWFLDALIHPGQDWQDPQSWSYFGKMGPYITGDSLWEVIKGNLSNGKTAVVIWSWENGRYFHMLGLFLAGMLLGRTGRFADSAENVRFWLRWLIVSIFAFAVLHSIHLNVDRFLGDKAARETFLVVEGAWTNLSFMMILISGFVLVFWSKLGERVLSVFQPIGKMSLSNYVMQSMVGAFIYYGFGLGLYQYTGATYSFLIGFALVAVFWMFCTFWMKRFRHGPLEYLWHKATWVGRE